MEKNITSKQPNSRSVDLSFDTALRLLKRKHKVARRGWKDLYLEMVQNDKGDKRIVERSSKSSQLVYKSFDQSEILANDWCKLQ